MLLNSNLSTTGTNNMLILNLLMQEGKQAHTTENLGSFNNTSRFNYNTPEEELKNYQIQEFIKYIQGTNRSHNAYNDPKLLQRTLAGAAIISQDSFCWLNGKVSKGLATGRQCGDRADVISSFETLFSYIGYMEQFPVLFDRNWRIIDGYQRCLAARKFDTMEVPYIMYDISL
ncbi:hypothetical protein [Pontibacter sp. SGAir0037]|uniref:hypothetical protein n=1 Tax=Pontibacter sp. SGAir0037 TaxID=2571030 RepID=UPI0010CD68B8|nr:hypothetical protein [Pontibacter sp. SGAir0037]QCR23761.1 hypothetical protein C1N53_16345 [Pontibacter sp. SGAir0037]